VHNHATIHAAQQFLGHTTRNTRQWCFHLQSTGRQNKRHPLVLCWPLSSHTTPRIKMTTHQSSDSETHGTFGTLCE
jgi:hypothetical protein